MIAFNSRIFVSRIISISCDLRISTDVWFKEKVNHNLNVSVFERQKMFRRELGFPSFV